MFVTGEELEPYNKQGFYMFGELDVVHTPPPRWNN